MQVAEEVADPRYLLRGVGFVRVRPGTGAARAASGTMVMILGVWGVEGRGCSVCAVAGGAGVEDEGEVVVWLLSW